MSTETIRYTADVIVTTRENRLHRLLRRLDRRFDRRLVLLIERRWDPYEGRWALPGGHVDAGETGLQAAARELAEETGVLPPALVPTGVFDQPDRDPRGRYITAVYRATVPHGTPITAGDDARTARWWPLRSLPPLAFDHAEILSAAS